MAGKVDVLFVDDDEDQYLIFKNFLAVASLNNGRTEYNVKWVDDYDAAYRELVSGGFDICFVDYRLGGAKTGLDLIKSVASEGFEYPTVLTTSVESECVAESAFDTSSVHFFLKKRSISPQLIDSSIRHARKNFVRFNDLKRQSNLDPLTGLLNRQAIEQEINKSIKRAHRNERRVAVAFIDINVFKNINDTHGHATGDQLLKEMSARLIDSTRRTDAVGRWGGDEFLLCLEDIKNYSDMERIISKVFEALDLPVTTDQVVLRSPVSCGISLFPDDGEAASHLIHCADMAMYTAKEEKSESSQFRFFEDLSTEVKLKA